MDGTSEGNVPGLADTRSRLQARLGEAVHVLEVLRAHGAEYLLRAHVPERADDVFIRLILIDPAADPAGAARDLRGFERRAEAAARLDHPNILAAGSLQSTEGVGYYVVMDARERTLESAMAEGELFAFERSMLILRDVASALDFAAEQGVVHGQLEPSEIVLRANARALVADFAAAAGASVSRSNRAPAYRAPELWQRGTVADTHADIYALGVMAYEMISGRRRAMSHGAQGIAIVDSIPVTHDVPIRPGVGLHVNEALLRATAKRPGARFPRAEEFVAMLEGRSLSPPTGLPTQHPSLDDRGRRFAFAPLVLAIAIGIGVGIMATPSARQMLHWSQRSSFNANEIDIRPTFAPSEYSTSAGPSTAAPATPSGGNAPSNSGSIFPGAATAAGQPGQPGKVSLRSPEPSSSNSGSATDVGSGVRTSPGGRSPEATTAPTDSAPPGYIRVDYDGPAALVMIDEVPRGRTPFVGRAGAGAHSVRLVGSRAEFPIQQVRVSGGDTSLASFSVPKPAP